MIGSAPAGAAIVTTALTRQVDSHVALDSLDLVVEPGAVFGFLGPNGAGKTTTIRLLLGFIRPTSGSAAIFGRDCWSDGVAARRHVGYLVEADAFFPDRTGRDQLDYAARLNGGRSPLREQVLDALEFAESDLDRKFGEYSKGMKQKVALTAAIQHDPALLVLDEPTEGLDPLIQRRFLHMLQEYRAKERTVFMSSHDLAEVEKICDEIAIVRTGCLVARTSIEEIRRRMVRQVDVTFSDTPLPNLESVPGVTVQSQTGSRVVLTIEGPIDPLMQAMRQGTVVDLAVVPPSLDDVFMDYYDVPSLARGAR